MKKMFFAVLLLVMGMLFSSTAFAHEGEDHDKKVYEEGSGGAAMEMDHKASGMAHEYKDEHGGGDHSKEHYEKKYGKYEHEKKEAMEEGSGMKEDAHKMQEEMHQRKEEGSKM
jgi:hypothetical protein